MGTKLGFSWVVAMLGLTAACGGLYDVGSGASGGAAGEGGGEPEGAGGEEGSSLAGTAGSANGGSGTTGGAAATGGRGATGGAPAAGSGSTVGGGPAAGSAGFAAGGSGPAPDPGPGNVLGKNCEDFLEDAPEGEAAAQEELWDRVSRALRNDTSELPKPELEKPSEMVQWIIEPISSLTPPPGLREFIDQWAFADAGLDDAASRWGGALFMHGGSLQGLFAPFGDAGEGRAGFASEPDFLTAYPTPGQRGTRLLNALLCANLEPGPPDTSISPLPVVEGKTRRQVVEESVSPPTCLGCHTIIDPLGFSLEHFDEVGAYRETDNGLPVDASGRVSFNAVTFEFSSFTELAPQLANTPEVAACLSASLFDYMLGTAMPDQEPRTPTRGELDYVLCEFDRNDYSGQKLLETIVETPTFMLE